MNDPEMPGYVGRCAFCGTLTTAPSGVCDLCDARHGDRIARYWVFERELIPTNAMLRESVLMFADWGTL